MIANYPLSYGKLLPRTIKVSTVETGEIKQGYAFCYNSDYGVAANADESRLFRVEKPSADNHMDFAGVAANDYPASATGHAEITLVPPGNACYVYANVACVVGTTYASAQVGEWYFKYEGLPGAGRFRAKQTVDRSGTAGLVWGVLEDGPQSGLVSLCLPVDNDVMTGVITHGINYFEAITLGTGDSTYTLADGTHLDQEVAIFSIGVVTTNHVVITVTTPHTPTMYAAGPLALTAYGTFTLDAAAEYLRAKWDGKGWRCAGAVAS